MKYRLNLLNLKVFLPVLQPAPCREQNRPMNAQPSLIMIQFLQWVADRPRCREDVMAAWPSSCPRFPVWEDACAEGLVRLHGYKRAGRSRSDHRVELTELGRSALARAPDDASPCR